MTPELLSWIRDVGFPIALVVWLLTRLEPRLERVAIALGQVRLGLREMRRAQLLYVIGHPSFSRDTKEMASKMLNEDAGIEDGDHDSN